MGYAPAMALARPRSHSTHAAHHALRRARSHAGRRVALQGDWLKPGAVVIDVGVNSKPDATSSKGYKLCGDVDFAEASQVWPASMPQTAPAHRMRA